MADQMFKDWLAGPVMTELLASEDVKGTVPNFLPPEFLKPADEEIVGMEVMWEAYQGARQTSQLVHHMSPSRRVETPGATRRYATCLGTRENIVLDTEFLMALKSNIPLYIQRARTRFVQKMKDFRSRIESLRVSLAASALSQGKIFSDANGNLLPTSSGAAVTVDFGLLYGGANTLAHTAHWPNLASVAANLVGDWSSASFDIPSSIRALQQSWQLTTNRGGRLKILYGKQIPAYLYGNTAMQTYLSRQPQLNQQFMDTNEVPAGLLDVDWAPAYKSYYVDSTNTVQTWWADNQITIVPPVEDDWYQYLEAGTLIPTGLVPPGMDLETLINSTQVTKGPFSYVELMTDPLAAKAISGWYGLPTLKSAYLCWQALVS